MAMSEQSILRPSPEVAAALAFAQGKRGAERRVLEYVADATLRGYEVNPRIQKIANALLARKRELREKVVAANARIQSQLAL